jgi:hypothetical protein
MAMTAAAETLVQVEGFMAVASVDFRMMSIDIHYSRRLLDEKVEVIQFAARGAGLRQ